MDHATLDDLHKKRIALLLGGTSREAEISLRSGKRVGASLRNQGFRVTDINPAEYVSDTMLVDALKRTQTDVAFIILHGKPGEDGTVQALLEKNNIPFTGSRARESAICIDKVATKRELEKVGLPTPLYFSLDGKDPRMPANMQFPVIIKPLDEGSSFGISIVENAENLKSVARQTLKNFGNGFVEQYIYGKEVTVGILGTGDSAIALPVLELCPKHRFYDYEAKYTKGLTEFVLPAELPPDVYRKTQEVALKAYRVMGCRGFGRVDFIVAKDGTPYITEINTIPGMTDLSDLPAESAHAGISFDELVLRVLKSAWE